MEGGSKNETSQPRHPPPSSLPRRGPFIHPSQAPRQLPKTALPPTPPNPRKMHLNLLLHSPPLPSKPISSPLLFIIFVFASFASCRPKPYHATSSSSSIIFVTIPIPLATPRKKERNTKSKSFKSRSRSGKTTNNRHILQTPSLSRPHRLP